MGRVPNGREWPNAGKESFPDFTGGLSPGGSNGISGCLILDAKQIPPKVQLLEPGCLAASVLWVPRLG